MNQPANIPQEQLEQDDQGLNLMHFFFNYVVRYWYLYLISMIMALLFAYYYNWYMTPVYSATGLVMVKQPKSSTDAADILKQLNDFTTDRNIQNEIEVLRSRSMISKTVTDLNFDVTYFLKGNLKTSELYTNCPFRFKYDTLRFFTYTIPIKIHVLSDTKYELAFFNPREDKEVKEVRLFGEKVTNQLGTYSLEKKDFFNNAAFKNPEYDKRNFVIRFNTEDGLIDRYQRAIDVSIANKQSSILKLTLEDPVPEKAVDFINKLVEVWLRSNIEEKNELARNSLTFIDEQLAVISKDLDEVEGEYERFRSEKGITDVTAEAASFLSAAKDYDSKISELDLKLSFMSYLENYVREEKNLRGMSPASIGIDDALLLKLVTQLNDLQGQRDMLSGSATPDNPRMVEIVLAIQNTKSDLLENIKSIRAGLKASQTEATAQLSRVEAKIKLLPGS